MTRPGTPSGFLRHAPAWLPFAIGATFALGLGLAVGAPTEPAARVFAVAVAAVLLGWIVQRPEAALGVIVSQTVIFPVLPISLTRGLNPLDIMLAPALLGAWIWYRNPLLGEDPRHPVLARRRGVVRWALAFYGVAAATLVLLAARGERSGALDSTLLILRALEGTSLFFLVSRLVRTPQQLRLVRNALVAGLLVALLVNLVAVIVYHVPRAGGVWVWGATGTRSTVYWTIGDNAWSVTNPNELAGGCLLVWAVVLAMPMRRGATVAVLVAALGLLLVTLSRSGILGWITFVFVYGMRPGARGRAWLWLFPIGLALAIPILPADFRLRMLRTILQERGSFEVYTSVVRVFGWHAALAVFLAHPLLGVGYVGFRFVSAEFNPLGLALGTAESFYLETAAGMGVVGLTLLAGFGVAAYRLARSVRRVGEPGSPAHELGAIAPAFLLGIAVQNLTADNLVGLMAVSQLAVFLALVAQAGRLGALGRA